MLRVVVVGYISACFFSALVKILFLSFVKVTHFIAILKHTLSLIIIHCVNCVRRLQTVILINSCITIENATEVGV